MGSASARQMLGPGPERAWACCGRRGDCDGVGYWSNARSMGAQHDSDESGARTRSFRPDFCTPSVTKRGICTFEAHGDRGTWAMYIPMQGNQKKVVREQCA